MGGKDCNPAVLDKLKQIKGGETAEKQDDPRWDKLKQIFNN
jgi:hypothetical protein